MALETIRTEAFLSAVLTGDAGAGGLNTLVNGRIYYVQAPQGVARPFVVYAHLRSEVVQGLGTVRIVVRSLYQVLVIGQPKTSGQWDTFLAAADRIDAVCGHQLNYQLNSFVFNSYLFQPVSRVESIPQTQELINSMGGMFWVEASAL